MKEKVEVDFAIVGGGIIGLTTGYELKKKYPDAEIVILDKEAYLGEHSSGRNSGVLHSGLYYPKNSQKHLLCMDGLNLWKDLSSELKITVKHCGKYIFSTSIDEEDQLENLFKKGLDNNVKLNRLSSTELKELQINVNAFDSIYSPSTGIIHVSEALAKLKYSLESKGVNTLFKTEVNKVLSFKEGYLLETSDYDIETSHLINCAGLFGVELRKDLGLFDLENVFVKGNYLSTTQKLSYGSLYYPIPPKDLKGLGVHSTIDIDGKVKFGPNTEDVTTVSYTPLEDFAEMGRLVQQYFKNIDPKKLFWDYAGCRSKIRLIQTGELHTDFWIKSPLKNYIECLGIESPGVTAAPAIAKTLIKFL